jgi:hypothetical protein
MNWDALAGKNISQVVKFCGDGNLKDGSRCSNEFREFLSTQDASVLGEHARYCLNQKFDNGGLALQDIINEMGRRLGFHVTNGIYQGTKQKPGYDGIWSDGSTTHLIVEVKTSDSYRINLDRVCTYAEKSLEKGHDLPNGDYFTLIVVGREDTGDLEAQVRGSRHAWSARLISVEHLARLVAIKADSSEDLLPKIRKVLLPIEYTRVDQIIDLVFEAQQEKEFSVFAGEELEEQSTRTSSANPISSDVSASRAAIQKRREEVAGAFYRIHSVKSYKSEKLKTLYSSEMPKVPAAIAVSKRYPAGNYWYALHPHWIEHMEEDGGYFVLGCMDGSQAFALPIEVVKSRLADFGKTENETRNYWHVKIYPDKAGFSLYLPKADQGERLLPLQQYTFDAGEPLRS